MTARSVVLAVAVAAGVTLLVNTVEYVVHASRLTLSHFPMGTLIVYLLIVKAVNPALRAASERLSLSRAELLVVLAGGLVGGAVPSVGLTGYMLGAIAAPFYFATTENRWAEFLHPYIPEWLAPRNVNGALDGLFEGLEPGQAIPWGVWVTPVLWWMALVAALFAASACLAVILRKQWVQSERLTYPVLRPVLDLTEGGISRLFWVGFAIALGILGWNMISYFIPGFPEIPNIRWGPWVGFERTFPRVWTRVNMFTIAFAYFANIDVLFSLWFFDLVFIVRSGILNRLGYNASSWAHASADFSWLSLGAIFVLVFWSLWTARFHLKGVARAAWGEGRGAWSMSGKTKRADDQTIRRSGDGADRARDRAADDRSEASSADAEMMGYRAAVAGLAASLGFAGFWFWRAGMAPVVAGLFVFALVVLYLGVTRVVAEVGLVFMSYPVGPTGFVVSTLGSRNLSHASLTALAFSNAVASYGKGLFMPAVFHGAKIADAFPGTDRRRMLAVLFLAFVVGSAVSIVFTLYLGYSRGAHNFNDFPFTQYSQAGFASALTQMNSPEAPHALRLALFGIGAATMALLTFLKYRFSGWPIHPIGFVVDAGTYVRYTVFSVFLAWAIKFVILRIGGAQLYRRYQPFFLGVLAGYTTGVALSLVVDAIWFPTQGHSIHGY